MKNKKFYPWFVVGILWFVALLNYLDREMLATMQPSMKADIPALLSATNFGRLMAIFLWVYAFTSPVSGIVADRLNRKWLIVSSILIWSIVTMLMGYASTFNQLYFLRGVMGISEAFYIPAALSLIADYHTGKTRSLAIGFHTSGIYLGIALGGFGATIASNFSWQITFHSFGFIGIAYSIILIIFLKEKKGYVQEKVKGNTLLKEFFVSFKGLGILLGNISFWVILFYFAAPSFPGWAAKNWLPTLFSNTLHLDMTTAGPMATITLAMSSFCGVLIGGFISDKWVQRHLKGRIYTGVVGLVMTIPALVLIGFGHTVVTILGGAIIFGLGFGIFDVNNMPILCQFVSSRYRATGYGLMNLAGIGSGAFITSLLGKSVGAGNLGKDFALLGIVVFVAIVLQLTILHPKYIDKVE